MKTVLAFGCHPDDVEFMCAGTLAHLAKRGWQVHIAVMAGGEMGSESLAPRAIRARRMKEAEASAKIIGARFHYAGGYDIEVEYNAEYRRRAIHVMRAADPDLVLAPPPTDYMIDHEETSRLVRNAAYIAPVPNYDTGVDDRPTKKTPHLYYWNAIGGKDIFGRPLPLTCAVDIGAVMPIKRRMLACHASQRDWLRVAMKCDEYVDMMRRWSAADGRTAGVKYAEGFIQHLGEAYPQDDLLKQSLGKLCVELGPGRQRGTP